MDNGAVSPHFQRVLARLEEVQAQYRADRERVVSADEERQAELGKLREENQAKAEQTKAALAAQQASIQAGAEPTAEDNPWATPRRVAPADDEPSFGFEEDSTDLAEAADTESLSSPTTPARSAAASVWTEPVKKESLPRSRQQRWDDDDFSGTDWTNDD